MTNPFTKHNIKEALKANKLTIPFSIAILAFTVILDVININYKENL